MPATIAQLLDDGVWIRPHEAVAVVRATGLVLRRAGDAGARLGSVTRLDDLAGRLALDVNGIMGVRVPSDPDAADLPEASPSAERVRLLGQLLGRLLPGPDAPRAYRVPDRLQDIARRAIDAHPGRAIRATAEHGQLQRFRSVEEFLGVLRPFEGMDGRGALRRLHNRWDACSMLRRAATAGTSGRPGRDVFDSIRRLRETVGVSVQDVGTRSKIAVDLLERFERGDLTRWPTGVFGRQYAREYAREAGLDPDVLLRLVGSRLVPDESIEFIKDTWRAAEREGRPPTFHDPANATGRYYPEPSLEQPGTGGGTQPLTPAIAGGPSALFGVGPEDFVQPDPPAGESTEKQASIAGHPATLSFLVLVALFLVFLAVVTP